MHNLPKPVSIRLAALLLTPVLFVGALRADHPVTDTPANISTVNLNLTLQESVGGYFRTDQEVTVAFSRGVEYAGVRAYDFYMDEPELRSGIANPFAWEEAVGNFYIEKTVSEFSDDDLEFVTVTGELKIRNTRYNSASLLADLAAAQLIPEAKGYRIVAVQFEVGTGATYTNVEGGYVTYITNGLYFFAEKGANDTAPIYLGAEDDNYVVDEIIDFELHDTVTKVKYVDTYEEIGDLEYEHTAVSDRFSRTALGDLSVYRPIAGGGYHELYVEGLFRWSENFVFKTQDYRRAATTATGLSGYGAAYAALEGGGYEEIDTVPAVVTGNITLSAGTYRTSSEKYLKRIPRLSVE